MIDSLTSRYLTKTANTIFWLLLLYSLYIVITCLQPIKESSEILAVKWCRNNMAGIEYTDEASRRGLYVFADTNSEKIILSQVDFRCKSLYQPYRYYYRTIMDLKDYRGRGSPDITIECLKNNREIIHGIN